MKRAAERGADRLGEMDLHYFREGTHGRMYEKLGAHVVEREGVPGTVFGVWAPNAERVSVIGDFNGWDPTKNPLECLADAGIFRAFVPGIAPGALYKYQIVSRLGGKPFDKLDPFAFRQEIAPGTASVVWDFQYEFRDEPFMSRRASRKPRNAPMSIYEVHLGSWMRKDPAKPLGYAEITPLLLEHVRKLGFTHIELLPLTEHPFYGSWGYETTGYFAATGRHGTPDELAALVDAFHQEGIGVIFDWVPAHFPTDVHALGEFDGTHLFEHADPRKGFHPDWRTFIFNYGRHEVRSFLLSSALFWIEQFHADGLRVDGVASMLYLDYGRKEGEWIPNQYGGKENLEAVAFLGQLNDAIAREHPDVITIAEESTAWPRVTGKTSDGGLGFTLKWDLGWMHDTLRYLAQDPIHRRHHHRDLTFRGLYAFDEGYVLPLSHDEVVHGKGSLFQKMAGDDWQKLANLRLLFATMFAEPGKKLLFMGSEFAPPNEWNHDAGLPFELAETPERSGLRLLVGELNRLHRDEPSLHQLDCEPGGFSWIEVDNAELSVISFERRALDLTDRIVVVLNYTPALRQNFRVGVPYHGIWDEVLNTDAVEFGGSGQGNLGGVEASPIRYQGRPFSINLTLPPLGAVFMKPRKKRDLLPIRGSISKGPG